MKISKAKIIIQFLLILSTIVRQSFADSSSKNKHLHLRGSYSHKDHSRLGPKPLIYDTDYGAFIDNIFALGLLVNSHDLIDLRYVITSGDYSDLGSSCVGKYLGVTERLDIRVGKGEATRLNFTLNEGNKTISTNVTNTLNEFCNEDGPKAEVDKDGVVEVASMLERSDRDDWVYLLVGGASTLKTLIQNHPVAASKLSTLVVMTGDWCEYKKYPKMDVKSDAETDRAGSDEMNFVLNSEKSPFELVYFAPIDIADKLKGRDYKKVLREARRKTDLVAEASYDFYKALSKASRDDQDFLMKLEAETHNPSFETPPMFGACAVMLLFQFLDHKSCRDRLSVYEFEGIHFNERKGEVLNTFTDIPRAAFSISPELYGKHPRSLPPECPFLRVDEYDSKVKHILDPLNLRVEKKASFHVALGFVTHLAKESFYAEMAERMAGTYPMKGKKGMTVKCYKKGKSFFKTYL